VSITLKTVPLLFSGKGLWRTLPLVNLFVKSLQQVLADSIASLNLDGITCHQGVTYVWMEGRAFSTKAESNVYRQMGSTIIGMTNLKRKWPTRPWRFLPIMIAGT
jgi:5'-methylthioadenosine phosphorylase